MTEVISASTAAPTPATVPPAIPTTFLPISQATRDRRNALLYAVVDDYWRGKTSQSDFDSLRSFFVDIAASERYGRVVTAFARKMEALQSLQGASARRDVVQEPQKSRYFDRKQRLRSDALRQDWKRELIAVYNVATVEMDSFLLDLWEEMEPIVPVDSPVRMKLYGPIAAVNDAGFTFSDMDNGFAFGY